MPKNFQRMLPRITPSVFRGYYGRRFIGALGLMLDSVAELYNFAVRSSWVGDPSGIGPAYDALGPAGSEQSLPRYPNETWDSYHARLQGGWETWEFAGVEATIIEQLALYGVTAHIVHNEEWNWDNNPDWWSRFWVVITDHPWTLPGTLGDGSVLDGTATLGSSATVEEVREVRSIVNKWKPSRWVCSSIIVVLNPVVWPLEQPNGTWGKRWNRSASACYWPGKG